MAETAAKALILDFGSVVTLTMFETHRFSERNLGLPEGTLTWMGPFDPEGDTLWASMQRDEITERDYWLARAKETGTLLGEDWTEMAQFVVRARGRNTHEIIRPEVVPLIGALKAAGKKLAVLSNELDMFFGADLRRSLTFLDDFDVITDGTYTEVLKPDARAYRLCLDALGLEAGECVFIDDQMRNVRGGLDAGLRSVHLDVMRPRDAFNAALAELGIAARFNAPGVLETTGTETAQ
ncbi:HAD-IA family hydrolase [Mesorhizobium sp. Cs1299R1N3]|uniref:HAD-IA family hydrolase n=1 Tax=Mesorhizobium sp. Cs1299R1N3 TaxID=3015173 RepID=UPI00301C1DE4